MLISNLQNLNCHLISTAKQVAEPFFSDTKIKVFLIAAAIFAVLALATFFVSKPKFVLKRDSEGLYTLPHFEVPGFSNKGNMRSKEFNIRAGDFVLDTANGILPSGWAVEK